MHCIIHVGMQRVKILKESQDVSLHKITIFHNNRTISHSEGSRKTTKTLWELQTVDPREDATYFPRSPLLAYQETAIAHEVLHVFSLHKQLTQESNIYTSLEENNPLTCVAYQEHCSLCFYTRNSVHSA